MYMNMWLNFYKTRIEPSLEWLKFEALENLTAKTDAMEGNMSNVQGSISQLSNEMEKNHTYAGKAH